MVYITIESTGESEYTVSYEVNVTASGLRHFLEPPGPLKESESTQSDTAVAIITISAIFCDFNKLQNFIVKVDEYNARLNNLSWFLTDATRQKMGWESRNEAVLDAVMKANQYAKAVGFDRVTPTDIKELEAQPASPSGYLQRPIYRHSSGVSLTPQDILHHYCVNIAFECVRDLGPRDRSRNTS
ncbi:hypothetical protein PENCOP_c008G00333 [Penicillium coprophilum]|uniref:Uncharacterized protein n=1 Tax=Penicillium coprophilum TaxID=36646 RepID=A0A1V6UKB7_9EURO|nr:hypothetical protein PENCOP_c008G00333 [Penicillium coprophilum]